MAPQRLGPVVLAVLLLVAGGVGCSKENPAAPVANAADAGAGPLAAPNAPPTLCEHGVPSDLCTRCNPDFIEVFKAEGDWCEPHGLPESHCTLCNPGLSFALKPVPADWCREHAVPESSCTKCSPALVAKYVKAGDFCREHGFPASVCPFCHPELVRAAGQTPPAETSLGMRVRLASAETANEAGIQTRRVQKRRLARSLDVVGRVEFNQNRLAQLSARNEALVAEVKVDLGDEIKAGQSLVVLASASVGAGQAQLSSARARLSAAKATLEREQGLALKGISAGRSVQEAETELAAAQAEHDAARASLSAAGATLSGTDGRYVLTAPFAGTVVVRDAVAGRGASAGQILIQVADLSTMWAQLDVPEADAGAVRTGQKVLLFLDGGQREGGLRREATVARVGNVVDQATRSVPVRIELPNPDRALKAGSFLKARIEVEAEHEAIVVPREAIQRAENRTVVFVRNGPTVFDPVVVELGPATGNMVEVRKGLKEGAEVVTTGAFLLKTEVVKDSIGAGCCEETGGR